MDAEIELLATAIQSLNALGFEDFNIRVNNRKILTGLMEEINISPDVLDDVFRIIDKLDKISSSEIQKRLAEYLSHESIAQIFDILEIKGPAVQVLSEVNHRLGNNLRGAEGIRELQTITEMAKAIDIADYITIDLSLVRGLNYYTGPIFEIILAGQEDLGSLAGGGRYDNLIGVLGGQETPAVGISLGLERIWSVMNRLKRFKENAGHPLIYVAPIKDDMRIKALQITQSLRKIGIPTLFDLKNRKLKKILQIADSKEIPLVLLVGSQDIAKDQVTIRKMEDRTQIQIPLADIEKQVMSLINLM